MGSFPTTYKRRVEKYYSDRNLLPKIAPLGTNHIDDGWDALTIYKGEIIYNLNDGSLYTSDDDNIIKLGKENGIISGLQVYQPRGGWSGGLPLWLSVTDGFASINGRYYKFISSSTISSSDGDILISPNTNTNGRYDLIYGEPTSARYNPTDTNYILNIGSISGSYDIQDIISGDVDINYGLSQSDPLYNNRVLLGLVFVPGNYTVTSSHQLRPFSVSRNEFTTSDNSSVYYNLDKINITGITSKPILNISPSDLIYLLATSIFIDNNTAPSGSELKRTYIEGQIVVSGTDFFRILNTHFVNNNLDESVTNGDAVKILGGGSGGGTGQHNLLSALGFDNSGHTGFQRETHILSRDPSVDDCNNAPSGFITCEMGNFWINTVSNEVFICIDHSFGSARWLNLITSVISTIDDKDCIANTTNSDGDLATNSTITHMPLNDSYVEVLVNGILVSLSDGNKEKSCYFSRNGGVTGLPIGEIEDGDELYWNGSISGYELSPTDRISYIYIIGRNGTWDSTGLSGPLWGGDVSIPS